jgi:hypothetical protein
MIKFALGRMGPRKESSGKLILLTVPGIQIRTGGVAGRFDIQNPAAEGIP